MKVSIMQPNLFMWCGLLKSLIDSDYHIILDNVKASKNSRYNRNLIAGNNKIKWLTIPYKNFSRNLLIKNLILDTSEKSQNNLKNTFIERYKNAPFFENSKNILESTFLTEYEETNLVVIYEKF